MREFVAQNFQDAYDLICQCIVNAPKVGSTRELQNVKFTINDINDVYVSARNPSIKYMLGELVWYLSGSRSTDFISKFASYWSKISDNGVTSNSAYGYLIKYRYSFDQMYKVIELLKKDPNSRRAVINLNYANPNVIKTKDEPCTIALQFYIRDNKLYCTGMMRSNDVWTGLPYDIVYFTLLQKLMADVLGCEFGTYTHFAVSLHAYEKDLPKIKACIAKDRKIKRFYIDYKKLNENTKYLSQVIDKSNVIWICSQKGILDYEEEPDED